MQARFAQHWGGWSLARKDPFPSKKTQMLWSSAFMCATLIRICNCYVNYKICKKKGKSKATRSRLSQAVGMCASGVRHRAEPVVEAISLWKNHAQMRCVRLLYRCNNVAVSFVVWWMIYFPCCTLLLAKRPQMCRLVKRRY